MRIDAKRMLMKLSTLCSATRVGRKITEVTGASIMDRTQEIKYKSVKMIFCIPNDVSRFRVDTFATKEPETLEWIDNMAEGASFWDIGANIGLYSVYAAKKRNCKVVAFEPSIFNLELLARNLFKNCLNGYVTIIPLPLSNKEGPNLLRFATAEWGGALSSFGSEEGWDGKPMEEVFSYRTYGLTLDQVCDNFNLSGPDYIKMDVDGIEHLILQGGFNALKRVKSVLVEINDDYKEQADQSNKLLEQAGLELRKKQHAEMFEGTRYGNVYNQIWERERDV